jgi:predicted unusual protein kinase regulating ubiquinone biosynthesis (AarF/ABC1/UbiB family)
MAREKMPTSRVRRSATVGRLAASEAVKQFGTRAVNVTRSDDAAEEALARRQLETAKQIVAVLGTMKGAAMKLGQVLSFLDVGLVAEQYREEFQRELAKLRDAAPQVSFKQMRKVIEEDLEEPISSVFADFDEDAIAAASIGQVYRATLPDGRAVAVKVQYPGVASAVRSDMRNLGVILRLLKGLAPGLDVRATAEEIRARIDEELDYELEAQNQRRMAGIYRGHPFIHVPDVITSLSRERVLVSEYVEGVGFEELRARGPEERDRLGEIVFRFFFGSMYRHHEFSGDPHPGNFLLRADGRVSFLDFGLYKRITPEVADFELQAARYFVAGDADALLAHLQEGGFIAEAGRQDHARVLEQFRDMTAWYLTDEDLTLVPEIASQVAILMSDPRSPYYDQMRHESLPPEHLFGRRLELLTLAVLSQLQATANWYRIFCEWCFGDPPRTELGRQEAEFYRGVVA